MPEKVTISEDLQVIYIDSWGDITEQDLQATFKEVKKILQERKFSKILVDTKKQTSIPSTLHIYKFGTEYAQSFPNLKVAIVKAPKMKENYEFFENVARNRGAQLRLFDTREDAWDWLNDKPDKSTENK